MIDSRRKLLTVALGECWHSNYISVDGKCYECGQKIHPLQLLLSRRTFATADDYEALREKVIIPHSEAFSEYVWDKWNCGDNSSDGPFSWWLKKSVKERNEIICDFGKEVLGWEGSDD